MGGLGGDLLKKCVVREWWSFFIPKNTTVGGAAMYRSYLEYFSGFDSLTVLSFLVAIK